jgi:hypothetical protein
MDLFHHNDPSRLYGYHCNSCNHVWDAYHKPAGDPAKVMKALAAINAERCPKCKEGPPIVVRPQRYQELKREAAAA